MGGVHRARGDLALESYDESLRLVRGLLSIDPERIEWKRGLSVSLDNVGEVHCACGALALALESYEESLRLRRGLHRMAPDRPGFQYGIGVSLCNLAKVFEAKNETDKACGYLEEALSLFDKLVGSFPDVANWSNAAAWCRENIARLKKDTGAPR